MICGWTVSTLDTSFVEGICTCVCGVCVWCVLCVCGVCGVCYVCGVCGVRVWCVRVCCVCGVCVCGVRVVCVCVCVTEDGLGEVPGFALFCLKRVATPEVS